MAKGDHATIMQAHPMSVVCKLNASTKQPLVMQLLYLPKLELVTARASESTQQQILGSLYPEDTGFEVPSEAAQHILAEQGLDFGADRLDRPYL